MGTPVGLGYTFTKTNEILKYYVYILIRLNTITYYYNISFVLLKFIDFSFF